MHTGHFGIKKFTIDTAQDWMEHSGVQIADVVNEDETAGIKLGGVGFLRAPKGAHTSFEFAYDEVLVVTKGTCSVHAGDDVATAHTGSVIYLSANTPGVFFADEDLELVYVASSPYGQVNRDIKNSLLGRQPFLDSHERG